MFMDFLCQLLYFNAVFLCQLYILWLIVVLSGTTDEN